MQPDPVRFMAFNDYLRLSMKRETELFLENLLANYGSIVDLLNGKYSFRNEELACVDIHPESIGDSTGKVERLTDG